MRKVLMAAALSFIVAPVFAEPLTGDSIQKLPNKQIEQNLPDSHPMAYFFYSNKLFQAGKKDPAVMWYYVGQIRFRANLLAHPELPADQDAAQLAQVNKTLGQTVINWSGSNIHQWTQTIDRALAWDAANPNNFTSKETYAAQLQQARDEMVKARDTITRTEAEIKADRAARGIVDDH